MQIESLKRRSFGDFDFTAVKLLVSIIAISFVGILLTDAEAMKMSVNLYRSPIDSVNVDLETCQISKLNDFCLTDGSSKNVCDHQTGKFIQGLRMPPLLSSDRPFCSSPKSERERRNES